MQKKTELHTGDCLSVLRNIDSGCIDLVYLDPPFFTQKEHKLSSRHEGKEYSFGDIWTSNTEYGEFIFNRLVEVHRVLNKSGSIFFHCDSKASHIVRASLEEIFGANRFRSEIIWHYRRWSNSSKKLLPAHQTIFYFTKSDNYTFNQCLQEYSPSTNVDQILQRRTRDGRNKSTYLRDKSGEIVTNGAKKGVPLGDVWDIPYLNPKAKERTGYPTQKPLLLLDRIIELSSNEGDMILDPFCGSGTTIIAANLLKRNAIGIDISKEAIELTEKRLSSPQKTESNLLKVGRDSYRNIDKYAVELLGHLDCNLVQRNKGIDAILKEDYHGSPVPIRVQRPHESISEAAGKLLKASQGKKAKVMFLIATSDYSADNVRPMVPKEIQIVSSSALQIEQKVTLLNLTKSETMGHSTTQELGNKQTTMFDLKQ